jgi:hypothetical protein
MSFSPRESKDWKSLPESESPFRPRVASPLSLDKDERSSLATNGVGLAARKECLAPRT